MKISTRIENDINSNWLSRNTTRLEFTNDLLLQYFWRALHHIDILHKSVCRNQFAVISREKKKNFASGLDVELVRLGSVVLELSASLCQIFR